MKEEDMRSSGADSGAASNGHTIAEQSGAARCADTFYTSGEQRCIKAAGHPGAHESEREAFTTRDGLSCIMTTTWGQKYPYAALAEHSGEAASPVGKE